MSTKNNSNIGGLILVVIGLLFLLDKMDILEFGYIISTFWPLILIVIGLNILRKQKKSNTFSEENTAQQSDTPQTTSVQTSHPFVNHSSVFGDVDLKISTNDFRGGTINTVFGDSNINISECQLAEGEHVLKIDGVLGDIQLILPKEMDFIVSAKTLFGDVIVVDNHASGFGQQTNYTTANFSTATKKLRIYINLVFGDINVRQ